MEIGQYLSFGAVGLGSKTILTFENPPVKKNIETDIQRVGTTHENNITLGQFGSL